jgi:hypothetical protein
MTITNDSWSKGMVYKEPRYTHKEKQMLVRKKVDSQKVDSFG